MPYQKSKQRAFQDAEQRVSEVEKASLELEIDSADFGSQLSHLKNEVNKAYQQVENALETATETQRRQLEKYHAVLTDIVEKVNEYESSRRERLTPVLSHHLSYGSVYGGSIMIIYASLYNFRE